jgi:hypothetical protein
MEEETPMHRSTRLIPVLLATLLALALAAPVGAHELTVTKPHSGEVVHVQWIGGFTVPEPAQDAPPMFGPFRLPPSHAHGLPMACMHASGGPSVTITAPPFFTGCVHGEP